MTISLVAAVPAPPASAAATSSEWTVLAHLDARGGLADAAAAYERQLRNSVSAGRLAVALETVPPEGGAVSRYALLGGNGGEVAARVDAGSDPAAALAGFLDWGRARAPAAHYALLVMGHGTGLLRGGDLPAGAVDPVVLARALGTAGAARKPLDLVALDTCYGGTVEVAFALRGLCDYLTAAPGLIYSPGLDWAGALGGLPTGASGRDLAGRLVRRGMPRHPQPVALVALDMSQLPGAAEAMRTLAALLRTAPAGEQAVVTYARAHCGSWGEREELADLKALVATLATEAPSAQVREAAAGARAALASLLLAGWQRPPAASEDAGALGVYFPRTLETLPGGYAQTYEFAGACGWADFLESYWGRVFDVLSREPQP